MTNTAPSVTTDNSSARRTFLSRGEAIAAIRSALKRRSGKAWSVKGGRGTAYGWLRIDAPPARRAFEWDGVTSTTAEFPYPSLADRQELADLLGLGPTPVHPQGISVPASSDYYQEYVDRANGLRPSVFGAPYWD